MRGRKLPTWRRDKDRNIHRYDVVKGYMLSPKFVSRAIYFPPVLPTALYPNLSVGHPGSGLTQEKTLRTPV